MLYLHVHVLYYSCKFTGNTYFTTTCIILQTTSQLESFMQSITSAVRLMDTRLVHITTKLSEMTKRQEDMELSMRLLHESVRKIPVPGTQFQPTDSRPQPMLSPHYHSSQNQGRTQDFGRGVSCSSKDTARKARGEILQNHAH